MKKTILALSAILISSACAEEWTGKIGKKPSNGPTKNATVISEKLDFIPYKSSINGVASLAIRVRNGKHKMGGETISVELENSSTVIKVGRIDITKPMKDVMAKGDGEHLFDTFLSSGKSYQIFYSIEGGKLKPQLTVRSGSN